MVPMLRPNYQIASALNHQSCANNSSGVKRVPEWNIAPLLASTASRRARLMNKGESKAVSDLWEGVTGPPGEIQTSGQSLECTLHTEAVEAEYLIRVSLTAMSRS